MNDGQADYDGTETTGFQSPAQDHIEHVVDLARLLATRAEEKLRQHGLLACAMTVFIQTNRFIPGEFYSNAATFGPEPTQDTFALIRDALRETHSLFRQGKRYWKAGVMLNDLQDATTAAVQMFPTREPVKSAKLMAAMDGLNGRCMVRPAVSGVERRWTAKAEHFSSRYTTRLEELVMVSA